MEVVSLGNTLEIAKERSVTLIIGDNKFHIHCTPENLQELGIGFLVSEGLVTDNGILVEVDGDVINVKFANLVHELNTPVLNIRTSYPSQLFSLVKKLDMVTAKEKFTLDECRNALEYLEAEWYYRTKAYHTAALVGKNGLISRAYDVARYNVVDKVIGMGIEKNVDFRLVFLLMSGRISQCIVAKCVRCGIPLLVSKAAIFDSAIQKCMETGLSAVSFQTGIAVRGEALII